MATVTLSSNWDLRGFRTGLTEMKSEATRFRDSFKKGIEDGGGFFGSLDKAFGKLATGRLAVPFAAVGAALTVAKVATEGMAKQWENMAASTERALQNIQAIESTRSAVMDAARQGDSLTAAQRIQQRGLDSAARSAATEAGALGDPSTAAGRRRMAEELSGGSTLLRLWHQGVLTAGAFTPVGSGAYDAANELYNQRQQRAQETRQEADRAAQLRPFVEFQNRSTQRAGISSVESAQERIAVAQGRFTGYEAASRALLRANTELQDARRTFGENDPRTQAAQAAALDAFGAYDRELTTSRRFRNDPTIAADSLARIGGGGNVTVFGNGRGELLYSQDRLTKSIEALTPVVRELGVAFSRTSSAGGTDIKR